MLGAVGVLAALRAGVGQRIDISLLEATLATLINQAQNAFATGAQPDRRGNAHPNIVPYETFATADGEIAVAVATERQWPRLCDALGMPELVHDPLFATNDVRVRNRDVLRPRLAASLVTRSSAEWLAALDAAQVPCGPVNDVLAAFAQPQAVAREMRVDVVPSGVGHHAAGRHPVQAVGDARVDPQRAAVARRAFGRDSGRTRLLL